MRNSGYTLIELIVVMTIVALLAGISLFALQGARTSARDGQRKSDLESIRSALELYRSDCSFYPNVSPGDFRARVGNDFSSSDGSCTVSGRIYLTDTPSDPVGGGSIYYYRRMSGSTYELCATLEEVPSSVESCGPSSNIGNYRVQNP